MEQELNILCKWICVYWLMMGRIFRRGSRWETGKCSYFAKSGNSTYIFSFGGCFSLWVLELREHFYHGIFFFFHARWGWIIWRWRDAEGYIFGGYIVHQELFCASQTLLSSKPVFEAYVLNHILLMKELSQRVKQLAPNQRGSGQVGIWSRPACL